VTYRAELADAEASDATLDAALAAELARPEASDARLEAADWAPDAAEAVMEATMPPAEPVAPARALVKIGRAATCEDADAATPVL
jgi:hypothetical protein